MSYQTKVKKCNEMLALARSGVTIWWRREGFHQEPFRDIEPKWHVLTGRFTHHNDPEMQPEDHPVWTALCEYRKSFDERFFEVFPSLRKTAPKKDTRCQVCVTELPGHLARQTAQRETEESQAEEAPAGEVQPTDQPPKEDAPS